MKMLAAQAWLPDFDLWNSCKKDRLTRVAPVAHICTPNTPTMPCEAETEELARSLWAARLEYAMQ